MSIETMTKLATVTVGAGGTSNITFDNIPQNYTDLKLVCSVRTDGNVINFNEGGLRFNRDVVSSNSSRFLIGDGTSATSASVTSDYIPFGPNQGSLTTANTFTSNEAYITNYSSFNYKSVILDGAAENNASAGRATLTSGLWSNPSPITVVAVFPGGGYNFVANSTVTLYGIKNARQTAGNSIKATGGNISFDGTYVYHVFNASGTFTPTQSILADMVVVAGGGGSGHGGGGAGGYLTFTSQTLSTIGYTCTVGAGGTAAASRSAYGTNGGDSQFGSLTLVKGGGAAGTGGSGVFNGLAGASGGGGAPSGFGVGTGGAATPSGQGNAGGGAGSNSGAYAGGGGGGAGAAGGTGNSGTGVAGVGGVGLTNAITGGAATGVGQLVSGSYYLAGGGGGGADAGAALGGAGGGGNGSSAVAQNGAVATGGGAGGSSNNNGYAGGSGVIIVRYKG
jgi:hypothetical protein